MRADTDSVDSGAGVEARQARILVVDDDPDLCEMILHALQHRGFSVEGAGDGIQALARLQYGRFDVVVTDLQMPRLDGLGLLREIRRMESPPPVVVQTAVLDAPLEFVLRRAGAFRVLVKGASLNGLIETVAKACGLASSFAACHTCGPNRDSKD